MKTPFVSVVIPVYNTGKYAKRLIEGILGGTYMELEIIIVDDGSSDKSVEILRNIKNNKVKIYSKENGGPGAARNFGIEKASGKYLMFMDSDDGVKEDFIKKMVDEICLPDTALVVAGVEYRKLRENQIEKLYLDSFVREKNESLEQYVLRSLLTDGRLYPVFNKIFDADAVRENRLRFDEEMNYGEDTKFVLDYLKSKDGEVRFVTEPLYVYNAGTETSIASKSVGVWSNWKKCYRNLKKWVGRKAGVKEKTLLRMIYLKWRISWLRSKF